jgi:hypothetical protein
MSRKAWLLAYNCYDKHSFRSIPFALLVWRFISVTTNECPNYVSANLVLTAGNFHDCVQYSLTTVLILLEVVQEQEPKELRDVKDPTLYRQSAHR